MDHGLICGVIDRRKVEPRNEQFEQLGKRRAKRATDARVLGAQRGEHEHARALYGACDVREQAPTSRHPPIVQIVDDDDERFFGGGGVERAHDRLELRPFVGLRG